MVTKQEFKNTVACTLDKLINNYSKSGYGNSKNLLFYTIIYTTYKELEYDINDKLKIKLQNLLNLFSINNTFCVYDFENNNEYINECLNPVYSNIYSTNTSPSISNPNPLYLQNIINENDNNNSSENNFIEIINNE